jgi:hypothetical protein
MTALQITISFYAIMQRKHLNRIYIGFGTTGISVTGNTHKQAVSIDLAHDHKGVKPHRHVYLSHNKNDPGIPPTPEESALIKKIKKELHLR